MSSKFMAELITFTTSLTGIIVSATALIVGVAALLKELDKIGLSGWVQRWRKKQTNPMKVAPLSPHRRFGYMASAIALMFVAAFGLCFGLFYLKYNAPTHPLTLEGSTNVYGYLKQHSPNLLTRNVLLSDAGSTKALEHIFELFDYGRRVADPTRPGIFALSSNGTIALIEKIKKNNNRAFFQDNYWLSINLVQQPLFVLYRGIPSVDLKVEQANQFPPETSQKSQQTSLAYSYNFVRVSEIKKFLAMATDDHVRLYLPEPGTGTRALFEATQREPFNWPKNAEQLPANIEQLDGDFPIFLMASDLPACSKLDNMSQPCKLLRERKLKVAFICADHDGTCDDFYRANMSLVVKLARDTNLGATRFHIANAAECSFARQIYVGLDESCNITGNPEPYHIIELNPRFQLTLPEYGHCAE